MKFLIQRSEKGDHVKNIILDIIDLRAGFKNKPCDIIAVDNVSLQLKQGEFLGIAGESGCGKSTLAYAVMNLLEDNGRIFDGQILYKGKNISNMDKDLAQSIRWDHISMVFQSAMNSLNPVVKIRHQLIDTILAHKKKEISKKKAVDKAKQMLDLVDIPLDRMDAYPHQLSGGMKQRIMIAMALVLQPELIIMDEPTTALDVVVQRTIIEKIAALQKKFQFSVIFITHDLSLLLEISDTLAVMYAGEIVEYGQSQDLYMNPKHPYTKGLMKSFPLLTAEFKDFYGIPGKPPDFLDLPKGCRFAMRCCEKLPECETMHPYLTKDDKGHSTRCFLQTKRPEKERSEKERSAK